MSKGCSNRPSGYEKFAMSRLASENDYITDVRSGWCYPTSEAVSLDLDRALYCPYCDRPLTKFEQVALSRCLQCFDRP